MSLRNYRFFYGFTHITGQWSAILKKLDYASFYHQGLQVLNTNAGPGMLPIALEESLKAPRQVMMSASPRDKKYFDANIKPKWPQIEYAYSDPYIWESFTDLIDDKKVLQPEVQARDHIHTSFLVTGNYTNQSGEGLAVQHFGTIPNRNWLQKYGRVRMLQMQHPNTANKFLAPVGTPARSRLAVHVHEFSDVGLVAVTENAVDDILPEIIERDNPVIINSKNVIGGKSGVALLDIKPKDIGEDFDLDRYEFVTKKLFMTRNTPVRDCLELLGAGATDFFYEENFPLEILDKTPTELTCDEFKQITRTLSYWPFQPDTFLDFVEDNSLNMSRR